MDKVTTERRGYRAGARRRDVLGLAIAAPLGALTVRPVLAQTPVKTPRIGFLVSYSTDAAVRFVKPFRAGLAELNYVEGRNILVEYHWANGSADRE
jgi:putative ABC transport system substrate-binding protein